MKSALGCKDGMHEVIGSYFAVSVDIKFASARLFPRLTLQSFDQGRLQHQLASCYLTANRVSIILRIQEARRLRLNAASTAYSVC